MEDYQLTKEEGYGIVERIQLGAADLRAEGANAAQILAERGYPDADAEAWAAQKESAARAADRYADELRAKLDGMQPGAQLAADVYRQADQVANAAELGGILIDGRPMAERSAAASHTWSGEADKLAWEAGTHPAQEKAAEIAGAGVFEHVAETIDGVEQVPFWRLAAGTEDRGHQDADDDADGM